MYIGVGGDSEFAEYFAPEGQRGIWSNMVRCTFMSSHGHRTTLLSCHVPHIHHFHYITHADVVTEVALTCEAP